MIVLVHNRYRVLGGEERAVADLEWLIRARLGEDVEVVEADSARLSGSAAARRLLRGGGDGEADALAARVRATGARVVHAHNVHPSFGWRSLAAAGAAGARVVLHLHNYRLVCANGVCFTGGEDCTRCHGRNTLPGVRLNCRGGSRVEAAVYGAALAAWQRRLLASVDHVVVPSAFALARLRELGAPLGPGDGGARPARAGQPVVAGPPVTVLGSVQRTFADRSTADTGEFVLFAGRVAAEKGIFDAVAAARAADLPLVVAGDGPALDELRAQAGPAPAGPLDRAAGGGFRLDLLGRVEPATLDGLRRRAAIAIVPSRYAEILPLAALEAMAAGLPTVATRTGGLADAVPAEGLAPVGDVDALASRLRLLWRDAAAGDRALAHARAIAAPEVVAAGLRSVYADGSRDAARSA